MSWLGHEGLQFMQIFNDTEQEKCRPSAGLFEVASEKFKPQHNETILSMQYCKLTREQNENAEEWMGRIRLKVIECSFKERDRRLKEQFINGISNEEMMTKIIREVTQIKKNKITSEQMLNWEKE